MKMMTMKTFVVVLTLLFHSALSYAVDLVPVRVGVLQFGTVNWELDVIQHHGLAARQGVDLKVVPLGSKTALSVALQGGAVDVVVTDWIWVSRQRAETRKYSFFPYSRTVGALFVRPDANVKSLGDLKGRTLGIAGGPVDKSWLLLRAYARKTLGLDLKDSLEPTFAAPPLLNQLMLRGDLPAVLNFWHYGARLKAAGMYELITVIDLLAGLGIDAEVPLLGWAFDEDWADRNRAALLGFLTAAYQAKKILAESDAEWMRIRELTKAEDDATLNALKNSYRDGIPRKFGEAELRAAEQVFAILAREGGRELVGRSSTTLTPGTFWNGTSPQALMQ